MKIRSGVALVALLLAAGCSGDDNNTNLGNNGNTNNGQTNNGQTTGSDMGTEDTGGGGGDDMGGGGDDMGGGGDDAGTDMGTTSAWTVTAHDCVGNRTDALFCDDDQTCFVGCGTTTVGTGLYATGDGGASWTTLTTNPAAFFDTARVNSIWRGADGPLYVAGDLPNSAGVVSVADSGALEAVFTRGNQVGNSFTVGKFRRASNQFAIAESLNGVELVIREADGSDTDWSAGRGFWNDGDPDDDTFGIQILDMEVYNDQFWAVGSTISQPPYVLTPKWTAGDFDFGLVQMATGLGAFDGELWGIDVNADGVAAGGVNQDRDTGVVYTIADGADATDSANWTMFDVSTIFPDNTTWVTDVCRGDSNRVYAVGRETSQGWGFVLESTDGGATFSDLTPYDADGNSTFPDVSRCQAFADGVIVAGAEGLFARNF